MMFLQLVCHIFQIEFACTCHILFVCFFCLVFFFNLLRGYLHETGTNTEWVLIGLHTFSSYAFTWHRPDNELRMVWLRLGCWAERRNSRTGLSSYRSHVNDIKSQTGSRNFKPVCFWVSHTFSRQIVSFRPGFMWAAAKISYRSEFVPVSCKYHLTFLHFT